MDRDMMTELIENQWGAFFMQSAPRMRFFTPRPVFWEHLRRIVDENDIKVVHDCGTGNGDLVIEGRDENIRIAGNDLLLREGNMPVDPVQIMPAHRMPFDKNFWAMTCRPDHGGWVQHLFEIAHDAGAGFIYVSLPRHIEAETDLDFGLDPWDEEYRDVGEDGESMLIWYPR